MGNRLKAHDERKEFLNALAILMGCRETLDELPDGTMPDVLRADTERNILFVGDAKNSETPGCAETQVRINGYLKWLASYLHSGGKKGILSLCFVHGADKQGWWRTITLLTNELGIQYSSAGDEEFGDGFNVLWFVFN